MSPLWHDALDGTRTFYTLQNARQEHCKHNSDSEQQVSLLPDIVQEGTEVCLLKVIAFSSIWYICSCVGEVIRDKCVRDIAQHTG